MSAVAVPGLEIGLSERSPSRTICEADVASFAGLSGDYNALHTDAQTAAETRFGQRVAHGLLVTSIASGLFTRTTMSQAIQPALVAMLGVEARFTAPVFFGDTIYVDATVKDVRPTRDDTLAVATIERLVFKSDGTQAQEIVTAMLMRPQT